MKIKNWELITSLLPLFILLCAVEIGGCEGTNDVVNEAIDKATDAAKKQCPQYISNIDEYLSKIPAAEAAAESAKANEEKVKKAFDDLERQRP